MKSSPGLQSKNARVFNEGKEDGFENKVENRAENDCDALISYSITSVSRAGRDGKGNVRDGKKGTRSDGRRI